MQFPLTFWDISLWLAITAITLLVTSEILSPHYEPLNINIDRKRLRNTAIATSILFLATVMIRIIGIIITL